MIARAFRWLARLFERKPPTILQLPVFYAVIVSPGFNNVCYETTRSIHRARGVCRELQAKGQPVALATYTADSITKEF